VLILHQDDIRTGRLFSNADPLDNLMQVNDGVSPSIHAKWDEGEFGLRSAGIMLDKLGRVLLCRVADDDEELWMIPGGSAELHETSEETLMREFVEEADFEIKIQRLLWIEENFFIHEGVNWHGLGLYFLVTPKDPSGKWELDEFYGQENDLADGKEHPLIFRWFNRSDLHKVNLLPSEHRELLKAIPDHPTHLVHVTADESD